MSEKTFQEDKSTNCLHILCYLALTALEIIIYLKYLIFIYFILKNYVSIWHTNTIKGFIFSDQCYMQLNFKALQFLKKKTMKSSF